MGEYHRGEQKLAGHEMDDTLITTMYSESGPTYFSPQGTSRTLDHCVGPVEFTILSKNAGCSGKQDSDSQIIPVGLPRDHVPILLNLRCTPGDVGGATDFFMVLRQDLQKMEAEPPNPTDHDAAPFGGMRGTRADGSWSGFADDLFIKDVLPDHTAHSAKDAILNNAASLDNTVVKDRYKQNLRKLEIVPSKTPRRQICFQREQQSGNRVQTTDDGGTAGLLVRTIATESQTVPKL